MTKKTKKYLSNASLMEEFWKCRSLQEKYPEGPPGRWMTDNMAQMLSLLVDRYAKKPNWSGYSFLEDMKQEALIILVQNAMKFDPSKSKYPNPFAYYTTTVYRAFLTYLSSQHKQRDIKDAMLNDLGHPGSHHSQEKNHDNFLPDDH